MRKTQLLGIAILMGFGLSGCAVPGKVTGGGSMPSASGVPGEKANLGFKAEQCALDVVASGQYNYRDDRAPGFPGGVALNGAVLEAGECVSPNPSLPLDFACFVCTHNFPGLPAYGFVVDYRSTNPNVPDILPAGQTAVACVTDNGEGVKATSADFGRIFVQTGPYAGYNNSGPIKGNIQRHECTE
jgi:hypothetical protein